MLSYNFTPLLLLTVILFVQLRLIAVGTTTVLHKKHKLGTICALYILPSLHSVASHHRAELVW